MNQKKRTLAITLLVLFLLMVPLVWITYREYRQARLDHALIEAIKAGNDQKALEALAEGASGDARDTGEPPTFREALEHLLDRFRHPGQKQDEGADLPALLLLFHADQSRMVYYTNRSHISSPTPMLLPEGSLTMIRALLNHGARVNDRDMYGESALWFASFDSSVSIVKLLLERGADTELKDHTLGHTALMVAADPEVIKLLLEHGANIEAVDGHGRTPLMNAAVQCRSSVVGILLEHGAKVSGNKFAGITPLDMVRGDPDPDARKIAALLHRYGAK